MVKIKDFTLASQNLGGGALAPRALHTGRPCLYLCKIIVLVIIQDIW